MRGEDRSFRNIECVAHRFVGNVRDIDQHSEPIHSCLAAAERLIASDEHTPRALLAGVQTRWVEFSELADLPNAEHLFLNVNTPADYERANSILALQNRER